MAGDGGFAHGESLAQKVVALEHEGTGETTYPLPDGQDPEDDVSDTTSEAETDLQAAQGWAAAQHVQGDSVHASGSLRQIASRKHIQEPPALEEVFAEGVKTTLRNKTGSDVEDVLQDPADDVLLPCEGRSTAAPSVAGKPPRCQMRVITTEHTFSAPLLREPMRDGLDISPVSAAVGSHAMPTIASVAATMRRSGEVAPAAVPEPGSIDGPVREEEEAMAEAQEQEEEIDGDLEEVWADVGARTEEMRRKEVENAGKAVRNEDDPRFKLISYKEVRDWVYQSPPDRRVLQPLDEEEVSDFRCGCIGRRRMRSQVPNLDKKLWASKDILLSLKMTHFDFNEEHHFRMLRTIYIKLTRSKVCPSVGGHWADIGFQGGDPCTDLNRSGGVLNVYLLFYFFSHHFELMKAAFLLAGSSEHHFPLGCISINLTQMVMNAFLEGKLSSMCNNCGSSCDVLETTCRVFSAALHYFAHRWRTQKRSIKDTEKTMNEVRSLLHKNPKQLIRELTNGEQDQRAKNDPNRWEFTDLEFGGARKAPSQNTAKGGAPAVSPRKFKNYGVADD